MDEQAHVEKFYKKLGSKIKDLRVAKGYTQEDMTEFGFSTRFYQRIEAGKSIHLKTVLKIAKAFKVSLSELFKGL